jgi:VanZ family protein
MSVLRWTCWFLLSAYWGAIFVLTHLPPEDIVRAPHFWDKAEHFLAYFVLAGLFGTTLVVTFPLRRHLPLLVFATGLTYGIVDELLQPLVRRDAELLDWVADSLGVWAAVVILWMLRKYAFPRLGFPVPRRSTPVDGAEQSGGPADAVRPVHR